MKINLLILDDNKILIESMKLLLSSQDFIDKVYAADQWGQALRTIQDETIHVALIDFELSTDEIDGFEITSYLKAHHPQVKVIIFTSHLRTDYVHELCDRIGAEGYLSKHADVECLVEAILSVSNGDRYLDEEIKKILAIGTRIKISDREEEVLSLLAKGKIKKEIASALFLSVHTIEGHVTNLRSKFGASNTPELVAKYVNYKKANHESDSKTAPFKKV